MQPELIVDLKLYPTSEGGRRGPIFGKWFGCPCMLRKDGPEGRDCRVLLDGRSVAPGESARVGMIFLSPDSAALFRAAGKFYLWDGRIIGEASVIDSKGAT
jgi:hypothetical protein